MQFRTAYLDPRNMKRYVAGFWQRRYDVALSPHAKAPPPAQFGGGHLAHMPELDGIRGWACASVLIVHCLIGIAQAQPGSWTQYLLSHTAWLLPGGVDLFFVLSGFLIGGLSLDNKDQPHFFTAFWTRRVARIMPVAYLLLGTYIVAVLITNHFNITQFNTWLLQKNPAPLWTYVTFTQNFPMALVS